MLDDLDELKAEDLKLADLDELVEKSIFVAHRAEQLRLDKTRPDWREAYNWKGK